MLLIIKAKAQAPEERLEAASAARLKTLKDELTAFNKANELNVLQEWIKDTRLIDIFDSGRQK